MIPQLHRWEEMFDNGRGRADRLSSAATVMGGMLCSLRRCGLPEERAKAMIILMRSLAKQAHGPDGWDDERFGQEALVALRAAEDDLEDIRKSLK